MRIVGGADVLAGVPDDRSHCPVVITVVVGQMYTCEQNSVTAVLARSGAACVSILMSRSKGSAGSAVGFNVMTCTPSKRNEIPPV